MESLLTADEREELQSRLNSVKLPEEPHPRVEEALRDLTKRLESALAANDDMFILDELEKASEDEKPRICHLRSFWSDYDDKINMSLMVESMDNVKGVLRLCAEHGFLVERAPALDSKGSSNVKIWNLRRRTDNRGLDLIVHFATAEQTDDIAPGSCRMIKITKQQLEDRSEYVLACRDAEGNLTWNKDPRADQ